MGSIIGHRIDYNGVAALRGQRHIPSKNLPTYPPPPGSKITKQTTTKQGGDVNSKETAVIIFPNLPMFAFRFGAGVADVDESLHLAPSKPQGGESRGVLPFGHSILSLSSITSGFS